jgi:hypothetical protein
VLGHIAVDVGFDFAAAVKEACHLEQHYDDDLFISTPMPSPRLFPVDLPIEPAGIEPMMRVGGICFLPKPTTSKAERKHSFLGGVSTVNECAKR